MVTNNTIDYTTKIFTFQLIFVIFHALFFLFSQKIKFRHKKGSRDKATAPVFYTSIFFIESNSSVISFDGFFERRETTTFTISASPKPTTSE